MVIATGRGSPHIVGMPLATPLTTFGDAASPRLRNRRVAGARFRCEQCGSVGLQTIGKQRRWPGRLAKHARKLR